MPPTPREPGPSAWGRFYRVFRWVVLAGVVVLVVLVLVDAAPPQVDTHPDEQRKLFSVI